MNKIVCTIVLAFVAFSASAKDKMLPLTEADAAKLSGKTLVVTRHAKPSFVAMTPGKAMFALVGAGAMISAGNKIVAENQIADPADILDREIGPALAKRYGMTLKPASTPVIGVDKAAKIAATQTGADYILDIRSSGWMFSYYPTNWDRFWTAYSVQVQLIDAKTGAQVSNLACNAGNNKDPNAPSREAMLANGAMLLKDMTQGFGWTCMRLLAKEQFKLAEDEVAAVPEQYIDVLAKFAAMQKPASPAVATAPADPAGPVQAPVTASDAPAAVAPAAVAPAAVAPDAVAPDDVAPGAATEAEASSGTKE